ncbi:MAG: M67 family metallopeptidase [Nitrospirales bacterium]|nr:M67 family metallopeptidase [Nitrospira sp.]MDR4502955.1 M67 family metallopeptidase [Nitrospirales bacterium]
MLTIPRPVIDDMIVHARDLDPHECCGMLGGNEGIVSQHYRITNILAKLSEGELARFDAPKLSDLKQLSPEERADIAFQMDAQEMGKALRDMRNKGIALQAFYHSHTFSPARPSQTDITIAMEFESYREKLNLPEPFHIIISLLDKHSPDIRAYQIRKGQSMEVQTLIS